MKYRRTDLIIQICHQVRMTVPHLWARTKISWKLETVHSFFRICINKWWIFELRRVNLGFFSSTSHQQQTQSDSMKLPLLHEMTSDG